MRKPAAFVIGLLLMTNGVLNAQTPDINYSGLVLQQEVNNSFSFEARVFSNGLIDQLCAVRYAIYKDDATTPITNIADYGTVTYTVRGQGSNYVTMPITAGQGYIQVVALGDTITAFTLGIFDNSCFNRNRPITFNVNFSIPGTYRLVAEIVSCSSHGIATGTSFTAVNCDNLIHYDSVAEICSNPTVIETETIPLTVCSPSEITLISGASTYAPGETITLTYQLGDFDNGINTTVLPSWLTASVDNNSHILTLSGIAPALDGTNASTLFTLTTTSTANPASCATASLNQVIHLNAPSVTYSPVNSMYTTSDHITFSANVFSNGLIDQLCGLRYYVYKNDFNTPVATIDPLGAIVYTVRGEGSTTVSDSIENGQGYISVSALNDTLQAFTLGIFDNYCVNRQRPINLDMNFTVPGEYKFAAEIVSCSNTNTVIASSFTPSNPDCGTSVHNDLVSESCTAQTVLSTGFFTTTICSESKIEYVSGDLSYFPGQTINLVYQLGEYNDGIVAADLPAWLTYTIDNVLHTITFTGVAPAYNPSNLTYSITLTTSSSVNPVSCPSAQATMSLAIEQGPEIVYNNLNSSYSTNDTVACTARIFSHGLIDQLSAIRYAIYRNDVAVSNIPDYGFMNYSVRIEDNVYDTVTPVAGSGFISMTPAADVITGFTLGIFDNSCLNRQRPVNISMAFNAPGTYRMEGELVGCSNHGTALGTSYTATLCDGLVHYDSVAQVCDNPELLSSNPITILVCSESLLAPLSGASAYLPGTPITLVYQLGDFDDGINTTNLPTWLTSSVNTVNHTLTLTGIAPAYDSENPFYTFTLATTSSESPATCPNATLNVTLNINDSPIIGYTGLNPAYNTDQPINCTARIYSKGAVDQLSGLRYSILRNGLPVTNVADYGLLSYSVRINDNIITTDTITNGSGFITMTPAAESMTAFTLGIFDNTCINRNRPVDFAMNFTYPGIYTMNGEIVACANAGTSLGTSFTALNCDGLVHYDSVSDVCNNPVSLSTSVASTTICATSSIAATSTPTTFCGNESLSLAYNVGDFDNQIDENTLPSWLNWTIVDSTHTLIISGTVPAYDPDNDDIALTLTISSDQNPAACPTATINQNFTILPSYHQNLPVEICNGDVYTFEDSTYSSSGTYVINHTTALGCDSIINLVLTVAPAITSEFSISDTAYTWNSQIYTTTGDYTQTFTAGNGCDSTVTLHYTSTVGIRDYNPQTSIQIYPNPTTDVVNVIFEETPGNEVEMTLVNVFGQVILNQKADHQQSVINMAGFAPGIYMLKISDKKNNIGVYAITKL